MSMTTQARPTVNELMLQRICSEFLEMPGLRLTCKQAQRLWGLDERSCEELLEFLVEAKFLCRPGHGAYLRVSDGRIDCLRLRMAGAAAGDSMSVKEKEAV
jgi:hypothetical protein